jgi:hypothetical protein
LGEADRFFKRRAGGDFHGGHHRSEEARELVRATATGSCVHCPERHWREHQGTAVPALEQSRRSAIASAATVPSDAAQGCGPETGEHRERIMEWSGLPSDVRADERRAGDRRKAEN